jgi:molecular chaperone GrpE
MSEKNKKDDRQPTLERGRQTTDDSKIIGDSKGKKDKFQELEHKYKRALADYQNLLKRTAIEKQEYVKYANEQLLNEILPVYDNLKMSLAHADEGAEKNGWLEGVKYVVRQFGDVLNKLGVEEIKTVGEKFDHHTMEAVEKKETDDKNKDGIVASEIMPGYKLNDKVIRAARVAVYEYKF